MSSTQKTARDGVLDADLAFMSRQASAWLRRIPPDETVYSALARFHEAAGFNRAEASSSFLLGHPGGAGMTDVPVRLGRLEQATSGAIKSTEATLRRRSMLAPYLSLMTATRRESMLLGCRTSDLGRVIVKARLVFNRVAPRHPLRLCRNCVAEQRRRRGFAYWRASDQWPGCWVCEIHRLPLWFVPARTRSGGDWLPADRCLLTDLLQQPAVSKGADFDFLRRVRAVVGWLAGRASVSPELLGVLVRERLVQGGHLRNEVACSEAEYVAVHEHLTAPLAAAGIPDFVGFHDGRWVRQILIDRRSAHPLRWAVLLAAHGGVGRADLDRAYLAASTRSPQPSLFEGDPGPRRSCAPANVYEALAGPATLDEAVKRSGIRKCELQGWLRRGPLLVKHRRRSSDDVRHRAACFTIEGYVRERPAAFRSAVMRDCLWAVRWLEVHDPETLESLLPAAVAMFDRQLRLDLESMGTG